MLKLPVIQYGGVISERWEKRVKSMGAGGYYWSNEVMGAMCSQTARGFPTTPNLLLFLHRPEPDVHGLPSEGLGPGVGSAAGAAAVHRDLAPGLPDQPPLLLRGWESAGNQS